MNASKIRNHVEGLFHDAPNTKRALDLKEELISNLQERYDDLLGEGRDDEEAFAIVVAGIGDVDELIRGLKEQDVFNVEEIHRQRQKSALLVSSAVGLYILSVLPAIVFGYMRMEVLGVCLMFAMCAVATFLIVFNFMSKPKYIKTDETIVEEFKEWKQEKVVRRNVIRPMQSVVWASAVFLFFFVGFIFRAFSVAWMVFILAIVVNQIIKLVMTMREEG